MNKKKLVTGMLLLGIVVFLIIIFITSLSSKKPPAKGVQFPDIATDRPTTQEFRQNTKKISVHNDLVFEVKDFINNTQTVPDPVNTDSYILAGNLHYCLPDGTCPSGFQTDAFSVSYNDQYDLFTTTILKEPISDVRTEIEFFLMDRLGIEESQMCQLHYTVSVPYWVNEFYAGRELGFSFCPGSVSLE